MCSVLGGYSDILHRPADSKRATHEVGYTSIADNIAGFIDIECLPKTVNVLYLRDDDSTEIIFNRKKAKFHNSCRLSMKQIKTI